MVVAVACEVERVATVVERLTDSDMLPVLEGDVVTDREVVMFDVSVVEQVVVFDAGVDKVAEGICGAVCVGVGVAGSVEVVLIGWLVVIVRELVCVGVRVSVAVEVLLIGWLVVIGREVVMSADCVMVKEEVAV